MKFWMLLLCLTFGCIVNAQEVLIDGVSYMVKGEKILKDGVDVSTSLTLEEKQNITTVLLEKEAKLRETEKAAKNLKKAEKSQKNAEKKQKKAEKALKQREKTHAKFEKAEKKYNDALTKYEKLNNKGKLSPVDEKEWLEKIEKLKEAQDKAKKKL